MVNLCISLMKMRGRSGWPSVEYSRMLIREAMLMRFIDSLIRRTACPPAVAVCAVPSSPSPLSSHVFALFLTFFLSGLSPLRRGSRVCAGPGQRGIWPFLHQTLRRSQSWSRTFNITCVTQTSCVFSLRGLEAGGAASRHTHRHAHTLHLGICVRVTPRDRQAAGPH